MNLALGLAAGIVFRVGPSMPVHEKIRSSIGEPSSAKAFLLRLA